MQNKCRPAFGGGTDFFVALLCLPFFDPNRLAFGKVAAHGEWGVEKVDGII